MIDLHCDTLSRITEKKESLWQNAGQWDVRRANFVGETLQVMALFTMPDTPGDGWKQLQQQVSYLEQQMEAEKIEAKTRQIRSREDMETCCKQGKMGLLLHLEGGDALGKNRDLLEDLYAWGVRSMGLTWNHRNAWADGALETLHDMGLSEDGKRLIQEMNTRGILLDLAHASEKTFFQALEVTQKPAYVSHANVEKLCRHPRNLKDEQIKAITEQGGVLGLTYYREFLGSDKADGNQLMDHMVYVAELVGCDVLALGSDFDGAQDMIFSEVTESLQLRELMQKRGFYPNEIEQILEQNAHRYFLQNL
jgi:membrane dipeptidase